jgi:hypothetical protein
MHLPEPLLALIINYFTDGQGKERALARFRRQHMNRSSAKEMDMFNISLQRLVDPRARQADDMVCACV